MFVYLHLSLFTGKYTSKKQYYTKCIITVKCPKIKLAILRDIICGDIAIYRSPKLGNLHLRD